MWVLGWVITTIFFVSLVICVVVLLPFDKARKVVHAHSFLWSDMLIALNPYWDIDISGFDNIDKKRAYVIVANHQSFTDIFLLYQTKMQFKWIAKESVFLLPIVGWSLSLAKHIKLKKGSLKSVKKAYNEAKFWLRNNISVLIFPEGTRGSSGMLREFKNGAFKLAIEERIPILPISIKGTSDAVPKGSFLFTTKVPVQMKILEPIDTTIFGSNSVDELRDLVRSRIEMA